MSPVSKSPDCLLICNCSWKCFLYKTIADLVGTWLFLSKDVGKVKSHPRRLHLLYKKAVVEPVSGNKSLAVAQRLQDNKAFRKHNVTTLCLTGEK